MQRVLLSLAAAVILFAGAGYYIFNNQIALGPRSLPQGKVCEEDTLVCQDGTVLKREAPECSFPPCPSTEPGSLEEIRVRGTTICLPPINQAGPQTLECALGIEADDGNNYALNDPGWRYLIGTGNGVRVEISGKLSKPQNDKYDTAGVIEIVSLRKL